MGSTSNDPTSNVQQQLSAQSVVEGIMKGRKDGNVCLIAEMKTSRFVDEGQDAMKLQHRKQQYM